MATDGYEKPLLGAYLSGAPIDPAISADMFLAEAHKIIFSTILALREQKVQVDIVILAGELSKQGKVEAVGGLDKIADLTSGALPSNVTFYEAEILREYQKRSAWKAAAKLQEDLKNNVAPDQAVSDAVKLLSKTTGERSKANDGILFADLLQKQFPPDSWLVENLIGAGLTVLTGASKIGKSWTSLQLVTAVDQGGFFLGKLRTQKADCLYLALEDTPRRIQRRLKKQGITIFNGSRLETQRRNFGEFKAFLKENPQFKLVVIDTFQKMMGLDDLNDYAKTVNGMSALKDVADSLGIALVVIHHNRKGSALDADFMESALGSTGINATADCTLTMRRKRGEPNATLSVTGRDVEDASYTLVWDKDICSWSITDQGPLKPALSEAQQQIVDLLENEDRGWTTREIIEMTGKTPPAISNLLSRMKVDGLIENPERGQWRLKGKFTYSHTLRESELVNSNMNPEPTVEGPLPPEIPPKFKECYDFALSEFLEKGYSAELANQKALEEVRSFASQNRV